MYISSLLITRGKGLRLKTLLTHFIYLAIHGYSFTSL